MPKLYRSLVLGTALAAAAPQLAVAQGSEPPNIIFIMADDLGYGDLSATGSRHIQTPAIDSLVSNGVTMTQAYANSPVCSPTRAALLTGRYQYRYRLGLEEPLGARLNALSLPADDSTIATALRDRGYFTKLIGKWHLGREGEHGPRQHGYDDFLGIIEGGADYFTHRLAMPGRPGGRGLIAGDTPTERSGYLTDVLGDDAVQTIRERAPGAPFFLSLHFTAPHWPWEGREDQTVAEMIGDSQHHDGGSLAKYREMVEAMDDNVAKVLAALRASGEYDNTIVVFTSDNGGERFSDTWPFIGMKGEVLEGGIHVPLLIQWPQGIVGGSTSEQLTMSMDFLPSFLRVAGGDPSLTSSIDGADVSAQWSGAEVFDRTLFWRFKGNDQAAVRRGNWKYVKIGGEEFLFDLAVDQHERADRKDTAPEILAALRTEFNEWNKQMLPYPIESATSMNHGKMADRY